MLLQQQRRLLGAGQLKAMLARMLTATVTTPRTHPDKTQQREPLRHEFDGVSTIIIIWWRYGAPAPPSQAAMERMVCHRYYIVSMQLEEV